MPRLPAQIGKYKIVSLIAQGGMGAVYKGIHPTLKNYVVLKKLTLRGKASVTERFKREARIMMDFRNDYIVDVYDHLKEGSFYYIVQEYVDGVSLAKLIRRERYLPNDMALLIFLDCCRALKYAHDRDVVHRDIKPENILISREGDVKLTDFGIASSKEFTEEGLTREGMTLGTPSYISPEQIKNTRTVDRRADIYSMGVMLYEMVTGKTPFPGNFEPDTLLSIQKGRYRPPHRLNPRISPMVRRIIGKAMHVKPGRRYQDLGQIIRILESYFGRRDPEAAKEIIRRYVAGEEVRNVRSRGRSRVRLALAFGVLFLALTAAGAYWLWGRGYYYDLFRPEEYGAMMLQARIRRGFKEPQDLYLTARVFRERDGAVGEPEDIDLRFHRRPAEETGEFLVYRTDRILLPTDRYRVTINLENQVFWDSFLLRPRTIQSLQPTTADGLLVETVLDEPPLLPLDLTYRVTDVATGRDITPGAQVQLFEEGDWVPWDGNPEGTHLTGRDYRFRIIREGYLPAEYFLPVKPYQPRVTLDVTLTPRAATLIIVPERPGIDLTLNHSDYYIAWEPDPVFRRIPVTTAEPIEMRLAPGEYLLAAEISRFEAGTLRFELAPEESARIVLGYDEQRQEITLSRE